MITKKEEINKTSKVETTLEYPYRVYEHSDSVLRHAYETLNNLDEIEKTETVLSEKLKPFALLKVDLYIIIIDYAMATIEGFINHIGNIFCWDWEEKKQNKRTPNFYKQWSVVMEYLNKYSGNEIYGKSPNNICANGHSFKNLRDIRNQIHHANSDKFSFKEETTIYDSDESYSEKIFLEVMDPSPVIGLNKSHAQSAFEITKQIIENIKIEILENDVEIKQEYQSQLEKKELDAHEKYNRKTRMLRDFVENSSSLPMRLVSIKNTN